MPSPQPSPTGIMVLLSKNKLSLWVLQIGFLIEFDGYFMSCVFIISVFLKFLFHAYNVLIMQVSSYERTSKNAAHLGKRWVAIFLISLDIWFVLFLDGHCFA